MDNYYSSVPTFRYLHNMGHNAIGTVRLNRICKELHMKKSVAKGTMEWRITMKMNNEAVEHALISLHMHGETVGWYISYQHVIEGEKQVLYKEKVDHQKLTFQLRPWSKPIV
jgi:hypothetical protein